MQQRDRAFNGGCDMHLYVQGDAPQLPKLVYDSTN